MACSSCGGCYEYCACGINEADDLRTKNEKLRDRIAGLETQFDAVVDKRNKRIAELEESAYQSELVNATTCDDLAMAEQRIAELEEELQTHINCATQYFNEKAVLEQHIADALRIFDEWEKGEEVTGTACAVDMKEVLL